MKIDHLRIPQGLNDWQRKREIETDEGGGDIAEKYKLAERERGGGEGVERNGLR